MKLKKLLKDIPVTAIKGSKDLDITGVCANSKLVAPGNLFIARKGLAHDGATFIPEAIASGAVAIVTDIYDPFIDKAITQIVHPDVSLLESMIAAEYYQHPSNDLFLVGITGTNGKTTTSFLVKHILDTVDGSCGLIGTIEYIIGQHRYKATRTSPDAASNQKMLREMVIQGCRSAVMEVTSHALSQNRVDQMQFDTAVFTNLTLDHLDYHQTMENYAAAKNKLFTRLHPSQKKAIHPYPKKAIINIDSPWHRTITENCNAEIITYAIDTPADLIAEEIKLSSSGTSFTINYRGDRVPLTWPLIGRYNIYNSLAATAVGLSRNIPLKKIAQALSHVPHVPGRLEAVTNPLGLKIYIDFAHTDDALEKVLETLHELKSGRIIVVFGCGGNRDTAKRPKMARACQKFADIIIVTSDNPRNEDPEEIARQTIAGFTNDAHYIVEIDRHAAIEKAIHVATPDDVILIAGKGHETHQIFAHKTIEFDDCKVASQLCRKLAMSH